MERRVVVDGTCSSGLFFIPPGIASRIERYKRKAVKKHQKITVGKRYMVQPRYTANKSPEPERSSPEPIASPYHPLSWLLMLVSGEKATACTPRHNAVATIADWIHAPENVTIEPLNHAKSVVGMLVAGHMTSKKAWKNVPRERHHASPIFTKEDRGNRNHKKDVTMGTIVHNRIMAIQSSNSGDFKDRWSVSACETSTPIDVETDANFRKTLIFEVVSPTMFAISNWVKINVSKSGTDALI